MTETERTEKHELARNTLPQELKDAFDRLVDDYKYSATLRHGSPYISYIVLADLIRAGWRSAEPPQIRRRWFNRIVHRLSVLGIFCSLAVSACQGSTSSKGSPSSGKPAAGHANPFLDQIRKEFNKTSPRIARVTILDVKSWDLFGPRIVAAWGIRNDMIFRGDFSDEMFGIFLADDSLTQIVKVIDKFPTPSWLDYKLRLESVTKDSVIVTGAGLTYGDEQMRRAYRW